MARTKQNHFEERNPVSELLTEMLNSCDKTQLQIAKEVGLSKSNVLTMFKQGRSPLPIRHVVPLCESCGRDPAPLIQACLEQYYPEI